MTTDDKNLESIESKQETGTSQLPKPKGARTKRHQNNTPATRIGQRFGHLTVQGIIKVRGCKMAKYLCKCDCGNVVAFSPIYLLSTARSCGCDRDDKAKSKLRETESKTFEHYRNVYGDDFTDDPIGLKFGRLTVERYAGTEKGNKFYECRCDCGATKTVRGTFLWRGKTKSCGCLRRETLHDRRTEGKSEEDRKLYNIWQGIKKSCNNPSYSSFKRYGAKGIRVTPEWMQWEGFRGWAATSGYAIGYRLCRRDEGADFGPDNCYWESRRKTSTTEA